MIRLILLFSALVLSACPNNGGNDGGTSDGGQECPMPANDHARLLTAPTTSTVVKKTPAVPEGAFP